MSEPNNGQAPPRTRAKTHEYPRAQRNAFRHHDVHQQRKLFAWMNDLDVPKLF
jgi:hypothetical protein